MINNLEFSKRLRSILEDNSMTASSFAEKINVQRSSISHVLSGRNKPSLDFILKILESFSDVDFYWLVYGQSPTEKKINTNHIEVSKPEISSFAQKPHMDSQIKSSDNSIDRIVIFYTNGTFTDYHNS